MTPDPMQLLRAANPVHDCDAPDFGRLLERLEHESADRPLDDAPPPWRGRFVLLSRTRVPRIASGRLALAALVPAAVAVAVAAVAIVSLHVGRPGGGGPVRTTPATGSRAYDPGQARGRVVVGSMHQYLYVGSGADDQTWGAEWFRTTSDQICVQAGRQVGRRLGYVGIDGGRPAHGRFHPWPLNTAVNARCIDRPAEGGVALMVVERVADSGYELPPNGACTTAVQTRCPAKDTATLYFGVLGSSVAMAGYGTERDSYQMNLAPAEDGEYLTALAGGEPVHCLSSTGCRRHTLVQLVHPGARAFVQYSGQRRSCLLRGPGTDGVMSGDCPDGLTIGPSPDRLTAAEVRAPLDVTTSRAGATINVAARFRTRVPSSRIAEYELQLSTPDRCPPDGGSTSASLPLAPGFRAGQMLTIHGTVKAVCSGTYHGAVLVQPHVGHQLTVGRFSFKEDHGS